MPLLIALHGGLGTGKDMVKLTLGGFDTLSDEDGLIAVYPDGIDQRWNDGRNEQCSQADDVSFISALIDELGQAWNIDRSRVYVTGMSNGAQMAMRLARELSDKATAVAVVAYAMPEKDASAPVAARPISVPVMTGTEDPLIPWQGGETPDRSGERDLGIVLSMPETVDLIRAHDGCS
jgi:polyhydroxybutyrate depolymerase